MLPGKAERRRADVVGGSLPVKFLGAQRDAYVEPQRFRPQDRESCLRVADEILLRDARARPKRVAAEEDVATNDPPALVCRRKK
jgi:hypothetical protein